MKIEIQYYKNTMDAKDIWLNTTRKRLRESQSITSNWTAIALDIVNYPNQNYRIANNEKSGISVTMVMDDTNPTHEVVGFWKICQAIRKMNYGSFSWNLSMADHIKNYEALLNY